MWGHCSLLLGLVACKILFVPSKMSLFHPDLWKSYNKILLAIKARFPGDSQSLCKIPWMGSLTWGSEPSQQWESFFGIIVLQSVGLEYGVLFYWNCAPPTISLWLILCLWMWGIFSWWDPVSSFQRVFNQSSSVAQSCSTLCNPMDCSTPGFPVHHQHLKLAQTHVHWIGDAIQPSHPLSSPFPPAFNLSQHQGLFQWVSPLHQVAKVLELQLKHHSFQ